MRFIALAFAVLPCIAVAQQRCLPGVYADLANDLYISVHINGDMFLGAAFDKLDTSGGIGITINGIGTVVPPKLPTWEYQLGPWNGNGYLAKGEVLYGACLATSRVSCDNTGSLLVNVTSLTQTKLGTDSNISCADAYQLMVTEGLLEQRYPRFF